MKKAFAISAAAVLTMTCGCGKIKDNDSSSKTEPMSVSTSASTSPVTTAAETTSVTTTTTTKPKPKQQLLMESRQKLGVYEKVKLSDFITETNAVLSEPDTLVDTSQTGALDITVKYELDGVQAEKKLSYTVEDTTAPILLNSGYSATHVRGKAFDLKNYVGYADDYDRSPVLTYTGTVDTMTNGKYPITATVTDSSGNATTWDLTITVADSIPQQQYGTSSTPFASFVAANRSTDPDVRYGIDVSEWQGNIDFDAVKSAGCSFVFMRAGYGYRNITEDKWFRENLRKAKAAGIDTGIYFYSGASNVEAAREQARWVCEQLGDTPIELPIAFDFEDFGTFQEFGMSLHDLNELYFAFADEVEKHGHTSILYSSKNFLESTWTEDAKSAHGVWLAHYIDKTNYTGDYAVWQGASDGQISGIDGYVDLNVMYKKFPL